MPSPSPQQICGEGVGFEGVSPSDGSSLLVLIRQRVSDAFLDRWCVLPFDGRSDGVTCSAKQVTSDLAGVWVREEEETQSDPEQHLQHRTTSCLVVQGSTGSGRRQVLSAVLVQRCRPERGCHPVFTSVIWENGAHPFFRENKRENGTPKTQCFRWCENNVKTVTFLQTHCNN